MTTGPLSGRRWAALLVFIALPLAFLILGGANLLDALEARSQAAATEAQVALYRARLSKGAAAPLDRRDYSSIFVRASSRSLAEAELQRRIIAAIERASAHVVESGAGEVPETDGSDIIEIRATLDTDNAGLLRFLHGVETGLPLMFVEALDARRLNGEEEGAAGSEPRLRVEARVRAHWRSLQP